MKNFKRIIAAICMISVMPFSLIGCAKENGDSSGTSGDTANVGDIPLIFNYNGKTHLGDENASLDDINKTFAEMLGIDIDLNNTGNVGDGNNGDGNNGDGNNGDGNGGGAETTVTEPSEPEPIETDSNGEILPNKKRIVTLWYDLKKGSNYFYDGEVMTITFKIREDAAKGNTAVNLMKVDYPDFDAVMQRPVNIYNGSVNVGGTAANDAVMSGSDFQAMLTNAGGNPGDEVQLTFITKNAPGFAGIHIIVEYDANVLEVVETEGDELFKNSLK